MENKKRVYLLGAGVNKSLKYHKNESETFFPPLSKNFFNIALQITDHIEYGYDNCCGLLTAYIEKYWKKKKEHLLHNEFDLEECFTLLQLQMKEALNQKDYNTFNNLNEIFLSLVDLFVILLKEFKWSPLSHTFLRFGQILYEEKPTIITFNYDDFIETSIEYASGKSSSDNSSRMFESQINKDNRSEIIQNSEWNWNRPLGYGIEFDKVMLYDGSEGPAKEKFFSGQEFYSHNKLYDWNLLKLHGSLNWWKFTRYSPNKWLSVDEVQNRFDINKDLITIQERMMTFGSHPFSAKEQLYIEPIIITPVLHKQFEETTSIYNKIFNILWNKAKVKLTKCKSLILIGYSFPPTDFYTKKLLLEAFSENDSLKEIIVVNPDKRIVEKVRDLCHFNNTIKHLNSLEEYIEYYKMPINKA